MKKVVSISSVVEEIFAASKNGLASRFAGVSAHSISLTHDQVFQDLRQFVFELFQNARDAGACRLRFCLVKSKGGLDGDYLIVLNDGRSFEAKDVRTICDLADPQNAKRTQSKVVGCKGIGFKSVFQESEKVVVMSGRDMFRFDSGYWDDKGGAIPWQIIPIPTSQEDLGDKLSSVLGALRNDFSEGDDQLPVVFAMRLDGANSADYLFDYQLKPLLDIKGAGRNFARSMLFSGELTEFQVDYYREEGFSQMVRQLRADRQMCLSVDHRGERHLIAVSGEKEGREEWLNIELTGQLKGGGRRDKRHLQDPEVRVRFATLLKKKGLYFTTSKNSRNPIQMDSNRWFCLLPVSGVKVRFPFLVDVLSDTDASRGGLHPDSDYNKALFELIARLQFDFVKELIHLGFGVQALSRLFVPDPALCLVSQSFFDRFFNGYNAMLDAAEFVPVGDAVFPRSRVVVDSFSLFSGVDDGALLGFLRQFLEGVKDDLNVTFDLEWHSVVFLDSRGEPDLQRLVDLKVLFGLSKDGLFSLLERFSDFDWGDFSVDVALWILGWLMEQDEEIVNHVLHLPVLLFEKIGFSVYPIYERKGDQIKFDPRFLEKLSSDQRSWLGKNLKRLRHDELAYVTFLRDHPQQNLVANVRFVHSLLGQPLSERVRRILRDVLVMTSQEEWVPLSTCFCDIDLESLGLDVLHVDYSSGGNEVGVQTLLRDLKGLDLETLERPQKGTRKRKRQHNSPDREVWTFLDQHGFGGIGRLVVPSRFREVLKSDSFELYELFWSCVGQYWTQLSDKVKCILRVLALEKGVPVFGGRVCRLVNNSVFSSVLKDDLLPEDLVFCGRGVAIDAQRYLGVVTDLDDVQVRRLLEEVWSSEFSELEKDRRLARLVRRLPKSALQVLDEASFSELDWKVFELVSKLPFLALLLSRRGDVSEEDALNRLLGGIRGVQFFCGEALSLSYSDFGAFDFQGFFDSKNDRFFYARDIGRGRFEDVFSAFRDIFGGLIDGVSVADFRELFLKTDVMLRECYGIPNTVLPDFLQDTLDVEETLMEESQRSALDDLEATQETADSDDGSRKRSGDDDILLPKSKRSRSWELSPDEVFVVSDILTFNSSGDSRTSRGLVQASRRNKLSAEARRENNRTGIKGEKIAFYFLIQAYLAAGYDQIGTVSLERDELNEGGGSVVIARFKSNDSPHTLKVRWLNGDRSDYAQNHGYSFDVDVLLFESNDFSGDSLVSERIEVKSTVAAKHSSFVMSGGEFRESLKPNDGFSILLVSNVNSDRPSVSQLFEFKKAFKDGRVGFYDADYHSTSIMEQDSIEAAKVGGMELKYVKSRITSRDRFDSLFRCEPGGLENITVLV